jgi:acyl-homoserine lactone acylase PvdQ
MAVMDKIKKLNLETKACIVESQSLMKPNYLSFLLKINRAKHWGDFTDATEALETMNLNIVYGDIDGNIGLTTSGKPPRNTARTSFLRLFNPEDGYIILDKALASSPQERSYLQFRLLHDDQAKASLKHSQDLHFDLYSSKGLRLKKVALSISFTTIVNDNVDVAVLRNALKVLDTFDGHYLPTARAPPLLEAFKFELRSAIYKLHGLNPNSPFVVSESSSPLLPGANKHRFIYDPDSFILNIFENVGKTDLFLWSNGETTDMNLLKARALVKAYERCIEIMGTKEDQTWSWSEANAIFYQHIGNSIMSSISRRVMSRGPLPAAGASDSAFMSVTKYAQYAMLVNERGNVNKEALNSVQSVTTSLRWAVDLGDIESTYYWIPFGNVGRPSSRWYNRHSLSKSGENTSFSTLCWKNCHSIASENFDKNKPLIFIPKSEKGDKNE